MKYYLIAALIAVVVGFWAWDRHHQYEKGKEACELSVQADNGNILLFLQNERALYEQKAREEEQKDNTAIQEVEDTKPAVIERIVHYAEASPVGPTTDVLSPDELRHFNSLVEAANAAGEAKD